MNTLTSLISNPQIESLLSNPHVQSDLNQFTQFYNICKNSNDSQLTGLASGVDQILGAIVTHELSK